MIQLREKNSGWTVPLAELEAPLQKGMLFLVEPAALKMPVEAAPEPEPDSGPDDGKQVPLARLLTWMLDRPSVERTMKRLAWILGGVNEQPDNLAGKPLECTLVEWHWNIRADGSSTLDLIVEKAGTPFFDRLLPSEESRSNAAGLTLVFAILTAGVLALLAYFDPEWVWALAGRNVRWVVGWSLGLLFVIYLPDRLGVRRSTTFGGVLLFNLLCISGLAAVWVWLSFAQLPKGVGPGSSDKDYADFAHSLVRTFTKSYWPIVLAALPWVALTFKMMGFEIAEKAASGVASAAKRKE